MTSSTGVRATTYVHHGRSALIAVASFVPNATTVTLTIDYAMLGLVPGKATLTAPKLAPMQPTRRSFAAGEPITVPGLQGWLLVLE